MSQMNILNQQKTNLMTNLFRTKILNSKICNNILIQSTMHLNNRMIHKVMKKVITKKDYRVVIHKILMMLLRLNIKIQKL